MEILDQWALIGPNRRTHQTVMELWLQLSPEEIDGMNRHRPEIRQRLIAMLEQHDVRPAQDHVLRTSLPGSPEDCFAALLGGTALALQQHAGHRVSFCAVFPAPQEHRSCVAYEYEHNDAGVDAGRLALHLLNDLMPDIGLAADYLEDYQGFAFHLAALVQAAAGQLLPRDAQAIIDAAKRLDIPCVKLERDPYIGLTGTFRVRPNGLLKLGHACHQRVVDGTFCIDSGERLAGMLFDREPARRELEALGVPVPARDRSSAVSISSRRAARVADRIGYPVVVKAREYRTASDGDQVFNALGDASEVRAAAEQVLRRSRGAVVEEWVSGKTYKIVIANSEPIAVLELEDSCAVTDVTAGTHRATLDLALQIAARLKPALLTLTVVSNDIGQPLGEAGKAVSLNIAPELDRFLPEQGPVPAQPVLDRAAEQLVRFMFPQGSVSRIPLVAVTGTNGKTTICALIEQVMRANGVVTGRAGTTGFYIDGERIEFGDFAGGYGHHNVLETPAVQFGILETARGAAMHKGLMFDHCDLAVCTNVTPDHLGKMGIETVQQMAELKEFIMQRARDAVVLNADDEYSAGMLPLLAGREAWLVSAGQPHERLARRYGKEVNLAVAEIHQGTEWIKLYDEGREIPVMPVSEIPITFNGEVRFNVSNVLQAAAACYQMGAPVEAISRVFATFTPSFDDNPGRLNFFHGLPFTVLFDFAHNDAGYRLVTEFLRARKVKGRRVVSYAVVATDSDQQIMDLAASVAGDYDIYICRNYPVLYHRQPEEVPALMKQGLLERGVPENCIVELPQEDWIDSALNVCRPGDLLAFFASARTLREEWEAITRFGSAPEEDCFDQADL